MVAHGRLGAWAAIVAVALLALAACGGGGKSATGSTTPKAPTKAQYVAQANAICRTVQSQTGPLIKQVTPLAESLILGGGGGGATQKLADLVGKLDSYAAADFARLKALSQPTGDHAAIERFLKPLETIVAAVGQAVSSLHSKTPTAALGLLEQLAPTAAQVKSAAHAYGLTQCKQILSF
jgi:hypothetical protein